MAVSQLSPIGRFDKILLAVDGSEYGAGAEVLAVDIAKQVGAQLFLLEAVIGGVGSRTSPEELSAVGRVEAKATAAGVKVAHVVGKGEDPSRAILAGASAQHVDMIVMGRRGRRGLARLMLGDATAKVIGSAPCSVLVAPKASHMWHSILIATDGSRSSDAAAITAVRLAKLCNMRLVVLSVKVPSHSQRRQDEAGPIIERVIKHAQAEGVAVEGVIASGLTDETVVAVAHEKKADLIVLGSHGRSGLGKALFGSKAERIINQTDCPVLVAKGV